MFIFTNENIYSEILFSSLQMYKFLYALRLVEHGFLEEVSFNIKNTVISGGSVAAHTSLKVKNIRSAALLPRWG